MCSVSVVGVAVEEGLVAEADVVAEVSAGAGAEILAAVVAGVPVEASLVVAGRGLLVERGPPLAVRPR